MEKDHAAPGLPTLQVLVLGMPRSGTTTLRNALRQLGYSRPYFWQSMSQHAGHAAIWDGYLKQKYSTGSLITQDEFEVVLKGYTSAADWPIALFAEDLIKAYPDAKIILSVRDSPEVWYKSFKNTIWANTQRNLHPATLWDKLLFWQPAPQPTTSTFYDLVSEGTPLSDFETSGEQWYRDHNQLVRDVGGDRILEFNCKQGWEPLCQFLRKDVPSTEFPRLNDGVKFNKGVTRSWNLYRIDRLKKALAPPVYIVATAGLVWVMSGLYSLLSKGMLTKT